MEIWKDIDFTEGMYQISSYGQVRNKGTGYILKQSGDGRGYLKANICEKRKRVHRLVALAFIPNPENEPQVNHINENKTDNRVDNLEWCDAKYNNGYGTRTSRAVAHIDYAKKVKHTDYLKVADKQSVAIIATDFNNKEYFFKSLMDAERKTGIGHGGISGCINGKSKTASKMVWRKATADEIKKYSKGT